MNLEHLKALSTQQCTYTFGPGVQQVIGPIEVTRPVVQGFDGTEITHFPVNTSNHEINTVAKILQGAVVNRAYEVTYQRWGNGEPIAVPGAVKDSVILALYPQFKGNYDQKAYDLIKQMADYMGAHVENIVFHADYKRVF